MSHAVRAVFIASSAARLKLPTARFGSGTGSSASLVTTPRQKKKGYRPQ
jgi:hypothetical protein